MEKTRFEQLGGTYEQQGDYRIPCVALPPEEKRLIGIYGQRHLQYLKRRRRVEYINLLTSGRLYDYLADIDEQARDLFSRLVKQMAENQGVTEQLKADNEMEWVQRLNNIRACATEIVNEEIICA